MLLWSVVHTYNIILWVGTTFLLCLNSIYHSACCFNMRNYPKCWESQTAIINETHNHNDSVKGEYGSKCRKISGVKLCKTLPVSFPLIPILHKGWRCWWHRGHHSFFVSFNENILNAIQQNLFHLSLSYMVSLSFSPEQYTSRRDIYRRKNFISLVTFLHGIQESYQQFTDVHTTQRGKM